MDESVNASRNSTKNPTVNSKNTEPVILHTDCMSGFFNLQMARSKDEIQALIAKEINTARQKFTKR